MESSDSNQRGFTMPELLVFCAVVGVMLVISAIFARPLDHAAERRNAERWVAVAQHMQTLDKYVAAEGGLPDLIVEDQRAIGSEAGMANLCPLLVPTYAKGLVYDPIIGLIDTEGGCEDKGAVYTTGLVISKTSDKKVTITAPGAEAGEEISLTKQF